MALTLGGTFGLNTFGLAVGINGGIGTTPDKEPVAALVARLAKSVESDMSTVLRHLKWYGGNEKPALAAAASLPAGNPVF